MARVSRKKQNLQAVPNDAPARIWKAALYVRLSVENNGKDSDSIENQLLLLNEYVAKHPYLKKVAQFIDNGYTGTDFHRPEFQNVMEAVQNGIVDCILVKDLSRFGREYIETSRFVEKICPLYGLRFIAVNDNFDTATVSSEGQLSASLTNIVNDYYAKDISRKVTAALQTKMERGDYIGSFAPHGYAKAPGNKNLLIIDPETAPVILQIFELRAEGISYMGINKRLNDAGIPSPGQYRRNCGIKTNNNEKDHIILWNKHVVTEILHNIVYVGHLAQKKGSKCLYGGIPYHVTDKSEWIVVKDTHEPIVSEELFARVQAINGSAAAQFRANSGKYDYLPKEKNIYGKKLVCANCGGIMKLQRSFSSKRDKAYFNFKCPTYAEHGKRGCLNVKMRKTDLDEAVFSFIKAQMDVFIDQEQTLRRLLAMRKLSLNQSGVKQEIRALQQKLANKQNLLSGMYIDLKEGMLSSMEYSYHRQILAADIKALETSLAELENSKHETEEQITGEMKWKMMIQRYYNEKGITAEIADAFIESIKLHEDKTLEIKLCYMDEFAALVDTCERIKREVA